MLKDKCVKERLSEQHSLHHPCHLATNTFTQKLSFPVTNSHHTLPETPNRLDYEQEGRCRCFSTSNRYSSCTSLSTQQKIFLIHDIHQLDNGGKTNNNPHRKPVDIFHQKLCLFMLLIFNVGPTIINSDNHFNL